MNEFFLKKVAVELNKEITEQIKSGYIEMVPTYMNSKEWTEKFGDTLIKILNKNIGSDIYKSGELYDAGKLYLQEALRKNDFSVWESKHEKISDNIACWKYLWLIEHENEGKKWLEELQKVCSIKAPCKLIISYGRNDKNKKGVGLLKEAEEIIEYIGHNENEELVVMFGTDNDGLSVLEEIESIYDIYHYDRNTRKFKKYNTE